MNRVALPLSVVTLALAGACSSYDPVAPAPAPVVVAPAPAVVAAPPPGTVVVQPQTAAPVYMAQPAAIRAGHGRVDSISPLPTSAATGSGHVRPAKRIGLRMDDGTVQYLDTGAENLSVGQRVEVTRDGHIKH